jgi:hypothetical protein
MTDQAYLSRIQTIILKFVPQWTMMEKADSTLMKVIGFILGLVGNTDFMTQFWTTVGYTTYRPVIKPDTEWITIAHEGKHAIQASSLTRVFMSLLYLLPIPLLIPLIVSCFFLPKVLAIIAAFVALACLAPIPAFFRMFFEFEAYEVTLACSYWRSGMGYAQLQLAYILTNFTGPAYYFMWPFQGYLQTRFNTWMQKVVSGSVLSDPYLNDIYQDLKSQGMLAPGI